MFDRFRSFLALIVLSLTAVPAAAQDGHPAIEAGRALYGKGDAKGAFLQWELAAEDGDPVGQYLLANMILTGEISDRPDPVRAAELYKAAAEAGFDEAMISLATLYRTGTGVDRDMHAAVDWLYRAADLGHPIAMFDLAEIFIGEDDDDVAHSDTFAFDWYRLAARKGVVLAQIKTGQMLVDGIGTAKDELKGLVWLTIARKQAEAPKSEELPMSRRAFPLDAVVATDEDGRTLRAITIAVYNSYARSLPARLVDEAEAELMDLDPASY